MTHFYELIIALFIFSVISLLGTFTVQSQLNDTSFVFRVLTQSRQYHMLAFSSNEDAIIFSDHHNLSFEHPLKNTTLQLPKGCIGSSNRSYLGFKSNFNSKKSGSIYIDCGPHSYTVRLSPPYGFLKYY